MPPPTDNPPGTLMASSAKKPARFDSDDYAPSHVSRYSSRNLDSGEEERELRAREGTRDDLIAVFAQYLAASQLDDGMSQSYSQADEDVDLEVDLDELGMDAEDIATCPGENMAGYAIYAELLSGLQTDGFDPLIEASFKAEVESGSRFGRQLGRLENFRVQWSDACMLTLGTVPQAAIPHIILGTLREAELSDVSLRATLQKYRIQGENHPCIYIRSLAGPEGQLMSIADARVLEKWLRVYAQPAGELKPEQKTQIEGVIARIDREFDETWEKHQTDAGERKRLDTLSGDPRRMRRSGKRVQCLVLFCDAFRLQVSIAEAAGEAGIKLQYVGYAIKAGRRERQHEACGSSSNWLATLAQSVINVVLDKRYKMHFYPVCLLVEEQQGFIAEAFLTRIASAYYHTGAGFCIDIAGKSMSSVHMTRSTAEQRARNWGRLSLWVREETDLKDVLTAQARFREQRKAKRELERVQDLEARRARAKAQLEQERDLCLELERKYESLSERAQERFKGLMDDTRKKRAGIEELLQKC
jgi:uncharacterized protein YifE (UPF0438 family)